MGGEALSSRRRLLTACWDQKAGTWSLLTQNVTAAAGGEDLCVLWYDHGEIRKKVRAASFNVKAPWVCAKR